MKIEIGEQASLTKQLTEQDVRCFADVSGDVNPLHLRPAGSAGEKCLCHGMLTASLISAVLGNSLPGPGTIYLEQSVRFLKPVYTGDTVTVRVKVTDRRDSRSGQIVTLETNVWDQKETMVISGQATVLVPDKEGRI